MPWDDLGTIAFLLALPEGMIYRMRHHQKEFEAWRGMWHRREESDERIFLWNQTSEDGFHSLTSIRIVSTNAFVILPNHDLSGECTFSSYQTWPSTKSHTPDNDPHSSNFPSISAWPPNNTPRNISRGGTDTTLFVHESTSYYVYDTANQLRSSSKEHEQCRQVPRHYHSPSNREGVCPDRRNTDNYE